MMPVFFYICDIGYPYLYDRQEKSEHFFHSITMRKMIIIFWLQSLFFIVYQPESCDVRFVFFAVINLRKSVLENFWRHLDDFVGMAS